MINQQKNSQVSTSSQIKNPKPVEFHFRQLQGHWIGVKTQTKSLHTMILEIEDVYIKYYVISESTVHCLSGWLKMVP